MKSSIKRPAVSAAYLTVIQDALVRVGLDQPTIQGILIKADLNPSQDLGEQGFLSVEQYRLLVSGAIKASQNPLLGLEVGRFFEVGTHGVLSYAALGMPRVWDCLKLGEKFARIRAPILKVQLYFDADEAVIDIDTDAFEGEVYRFVIEGGLCSYFAIMDLIFDQTLPINSIRLRFDNPCEDKNEYQNRLQQKVIFNSTHNEIRLPKSAVEKVLSTANPVIAKELEQKINELLLPYAEDSTPEQVREIIKNSLGFLPSQASIAQHLNLSTRTLRRRLEKQNLSYQEVVNQVRKEQAIELLKNLDLSIEEIAYYLGFSSASHFSNSFKKWTGRSPKFFRAKLAKS